MEKKRWYRPISFSREMLLVPSPVKLASLVIFVYYLGWGIVSPFLPIYYKSILGSYTAVGIVTALLPFFSLLIDIPIGALVNKVSKIWTLRIALLLYLPFSYFFISLKNLFHFVVFRVYHSLVSTPLWISSNSYVVEHAPSWKTAESVAFYDVGSTLSLIIGPLVGGILFAFYGFSILWAISIFAILAFLLTFILKDEGKHESIKEAVKDIVYYDKIYKKSFSDLLQNPSLLRVIFFLFFFKFCMSFVFMLLPLFLKEFGASYMMIGLIFGMFYLPLVFEPYFSMFAGRKKILTFGMFLCAVLFVSLFANKGLPFLFVHSVMLALLFAAIIPVLHGRVTYLIPKEQSGEFSGIVMMFSSLSEALGPLMAGIVSDLFGLNYVFLVGAIIASVLSVLSLKKSFQKALFS